MRYEFADSEPFVCEACKGPLSSSAGFITVFDFRQGHEPAPHRFCSTAHLRDFAERLVLADHPAYTDEVADYFREMQSGRDELRALRGERS